MKHGTLHTELLKMVGEEKFTVIFIKKNGEQRTMECTLTEDADNIVYGLMHVIENDQHKSVNLNTLISLTFQGKTFKIKDDKWIQST